MPDWDAQLYLQFADERTRPSLDLLSRIPVESPSQVVDLGCGPGNSTAVLRARWPQAAVTGVDKSADMLAEAERRYPDGAWMQADIGEWKPAAAVDVIFANAALHWVPRHAYLFRRLVTLLAPGGVLAVQMPYHAGSPLHQAMRQVAADPAWRERAERAGSAMRVESPDFYYDVLSPVVEHLDIWLTEYQHVMSDAESIVSWIRGSGLRPYLEALASDDERFRFEDQLLDLVRMEYLPRMDGRVLFPFRRLFVVAQRFAPPRG
jgi:trans-aconitate 2-methyltransferase